MDDWDGTERRARVLADELSRPKQTSVEVPTTIAIVGFAAIALLQIAALIGHAHLADKDAADLRFQERLNCYVVKVTQASLKGTPIDPEILTECRFLEVTGG